ncbi:putative BTB/POZ domain and WD-repeat protein [Acanthamoeba castellanii mimivirus]|nr:hypothetical protein MIMI_R731 [Acanthamoeba polyphaga mimivirus]AHA45101.1 putative BTB/POZ domain and WD-repeat protein [Hirudovirus strain Sangsue]AMZ03176.1 putative BTB/POZ domain and WD-repeat protein [Mimivirus Bombay]EJN41141.1 hypothetical protein lvs_R638 [Acanthamoeba polyphaga lentillevirus]BAV61865.1 putative BTB/POZ domain and WD-repeat protein [Acanthamoeba castellanii mimivirus]
MDKHSLIDLYNNEVLTDCQLHLTDSIETIVMNVHKNILYMSCPYFKSMFTNFREQKSSTVKLDVHNARITYDIVKSFYGFPLEEPNWKYQIDTHIVKDFLLLETGLENINLLPIPAEDFDNFIDVVDKIGYNEFCLKKIIDNIPDNYDLSKFPLDLLNGLLAVCFKYDLHISRETGVYIWSFKYNKLVLSYFDSSIIDIEQTFDGGFYFSSSTIIDSNHEESSDDEVNDDEDTDNEDTDDEGYCQISLFKFNISRTNDKYEASILNTGLKIIGPIAYSKHFNQVFIVTDKYNICVYDTDIKNLVNKFVFNDTIEIIAPIKDKMVVVTSIQIIILNLLDGKNLSKIDSNTNIISYNSNLGVFAYINNNTNVCIYSLESLSITTNINHSTTINHILYSPKSKYFIFCDENSIIYVYSTKDNYSLIKTIDFKKFLKFGVKDFEFMTSKIIVAIDIKGKICIWNIETEQIIQNIDCSEDYNNIYNIQKINGPDYSIHKKISKIIQEKTQSKLSISS